MPRRLSVILAHVRRLPIVFGLVLALAACGSSEKTISKKKLSKLVLQQADVGSRFSAFYDGPQLTIDASPPRADPTRFGREGGWIARYRRAGSASTSGPLVVASRADLFKDPGGAKKDLDLYRSQLRTLAGPGVLKDLPQLGYGAAAITHVQGAGRFAVRFFDIAWREANATAELEVNGFEGRLELEQAIALAKKQRARMRTAAR